MAYGRIYIENLRNKVTAIFDELKSTNELNEEHFIERFKQKYPKDYSMLQYEWEFKIHEFHKKRKGQPKHMPIRPNRILSNMYRNYYYKLVKTPSIKKQKAKDYKSICCNAGQMGFRVRGGDDGRYNVVNKSSKEIVHKNITFGELKKMFSKQALKEFNTRKEVKSDGKAGNK